MSISRLALVSGLVIAWAGAAEALPAPNPVPSVSSYVQTCSAGISSRGPRASRADIAAVIAACTRGVSIQTVADILGVLATDKTFSAGAQDVVMTAGEIARLACDNKDPKNGAGTGTSPPGIAGPPGGSGGSGYLPIRHP